MLDGDKKIFMTITLNFYIVAKIKVIYTIIVKKNYNMIDNELEKNN